ncbi:MULTISPECIES: hypothetical protein [unclassified Moraxella]
MNRWQIQAFVTIIDATQERWVASMMVPIRLARTVRHQLNRQQWQR